MQWMEFILIGILSLALITMTVMRISAWVVYKRIEREVKRKRELDQHISRSIQTKTMRVIPVGKEGRYRMVPVRDKNDWFENVEFEYE
jgi:hypothetical protein